MKLKKILKKLLCLGVDISITYLSCLLIKANFFKLTCDINRNSLDTVSILKNLTVNFKRQTIQDFKLGCFIGTLSCDLKNFIFKSDITDLTVVIEQGIVTLYIPQNVNVIITSKNQKSSNIINHHTEYPDNKNLLVINANISFGLLVIRNSN